MKKVLIVTYYWPPAGGISVLRCLKFAKYLRSFGWEPIIYTAKNPSYQYLDYNNEKDIPEGIEILKQKIFDPTQLFKVVSNRKKEEPLLNITQSSSKKRTFIDRFGIWVRGNFFIPDARAAWIKPSVKYLSKYLENNTVDAILSDGPPHTNTVIATRIAKKFSIPFLADFQDPWTQVDYYDKMMIGKRADQKHHRMEKETFATANKITIASPTWKKDLENIGARNVDVIYYGYDEDDFEDYAKKNSDIFKIFHAGLLGNDRNPKGLFKVIRELRQEGIDTIELHFAGEVDFAVKEEIEHNNLEDISVFHGMISRKEVYEHYADSALLILPINQSENAGGRIPGKFYEYMRSQTRILSFGPEDGDVKHIIDEKQLGENFTYEETQRLKAFLKQELINFKAEKSENSIQQIEEFSNFNQTKKLAGFLDQITA